MSEQMEKNILKILEKVENLEKNQERLEKNQEKFEKNQEKFESRQDKQESINEVFRKEFAKILARINLPISYFEKKSTIILPNES